MYVYIYMNLTCMYFIVLNLVKIANLIEEKLIFGYIIEELVMKQIVYLHDLYVNRLNI